MLSFTAPAAGVKGKFGAENGTRTRYLQLGKLSLYQVSYFRFCFYFNVVRPTALDPAERRDYQVSYFHLIANIKFLPECAKILFNYRHSQL